jgi:hypothetical protein
MLYAAKGLEELGIRYNRISIQLGNNGDIKKERWQDEKHFLSRICGVILVPGVVPSCDKGQFP